MPCDCVIQWWGWLSCIALYLVSKSLPVLGCLWYGMYMVVLAWANGMSSAVKSVSNLMSPFVSPRLVYNEIIEHYPCILSLAWVPEARAGLGAGSFAIPILWWLLCLCTAAVQVVWEQQAVASVPARLIPLSDTTFLWCMTWAWQSASENRFLSLLFPLGTEVLMTTFEIKIYVCLDLAYSKQVHSLAFQVPYSCLYTTYLVTSWALQLSRE